MLGQQATARRLCACLSFNESCLAGPSRRSAPPDVLGLWRLHEETLAQAGGLQPMRHLLQRLGLPPEAWGLQVGGPGSTACRLLAALLRAPQPVGARAAAASRASSSRLPSLVVPPCARVQLSFTLPGRPPPPLLTGRTPLCQHPPPRAASPPAPQAVSAAIEQQDASLGSCAKCRVPYLCPNCRAVAPNCRKFRTAYQCQHSLWATLRPFMPQVAAAAGAALGAAAPGAAAAAAAAAPAGVPGGSDAMQMLTR